MKTPENPAEEFRLTPEETARRSKRNRAIGLAIGGLCLLFYAITVFKVGSAILHRNL